MKDEEYERQRRSDTRPVNRNGTWWVGAFALAVVMLLCAGFGVALCAGL